MRSVLYEVPDRVLDLIWDQVGRRVWVQVEDLVWDPVRNRVWEPVGGRVRDRIQDHVRAADQRVFNPRGRVDMLVIPDYSERGGEEVEDRA